MQTGPGQQPADVDCKEIGLATREDVARWHGISVETVRRWVLIGKLPKPVRGRGKNARWRIKDLSK